MRIKQYVSLVTISLAVFLSFLTRDVSAGPELSLNVSYGESFLSTSHFLTYQEIRAYSKGPSQWNIVEQSVVAGETLRVRFLISEKSPQIKTRVSEALQLVKARVFYSINGGDTLAIDIMPLPFGTASFWSSAEPRIEIPVPKDSHGTLAVWGEVERRDGTKIELKQEFTERRYEFRIIPSEGLTARFGVALAPAAVADGQTSSEAAPVAQPLPEVTGELRPGQRLTLEYNPRRLGVDSAIGHISFYSADSEDNAGRTVERGDEIETISWENANGTLPLVLIVPRGAVKAYVGFFVREPGRKNRYDMGPDNKWYFLLKSSVPPPKVEVKPDPPAPKRPTLRPAATPRRRR